MGALLTAWVLQTASSLASVPAVAADSVAGDRFWPILVQPNARWVLNDDFRSDGEHDQVVVETYDVRKIGGADVARLRWTHAWTQKKAKPEDCLNCAGANLAHVAVTPKGLYLLGDSATDAEIETTLNKRPSRSEPPKPYRGTEQNGGRYLRLDQRGSESVVCMGSEPLANAGPCDGVCDAEVCISPNKGVVSLRGTWAPGNGSFVREGYKSAPVAKSAVQAGGATSMHDNPDPWAKLCDPGMKWDLEPLEGGKRTKKDGHEWPMIRIESTDPQVIEGTIVCSLKWFLMEEGKRPVNYDGRNISSHLHRGDPRQPAWYEAQYALDDARQVAITPKGLVVLSRDGADKMPGDRLGPEIRDLLSKDFVKFPGKGASAKDQAELERPGRGFRRWGFLAGEHQIWCYGYKDDKCDADDTTCHKAACFVRDLGLVALYFDNGSTEFPSEFTFYTLLGFPEYASWKSMGAPPSR